MRFSLVYSCLLPTFLALVPTVSFILPSWKLVNFSSQRYLSTPYAPFDLDFFYKAAILATPARAREIIWRNVV